METHNNASQTLFRMVSVRNPKLTETNRLNLGFIQRPIGATGFFDLAVKERQAQSTKMTAMTKAGLSFNTLLGSENEIESGIYAQLLTIGRKISKREILSKEEIKFTKDYYNSLIDPKNKELNKKSISEIANLWDNLIYQVVTQKDFYVKEAICHILKAIHIGFAQSINKNTELTKFTSEQLVNQGLNATIVLPKELFTEQVEEENISFEKSLALNDEVRLIHDAQKNIELQNNILTKEALVKLNNELKAIEVSYFNQKNKAYDIAYDAYKEKVQPLLNELKNNDSIINNESNIEKSNINERLNEITIPNFEFLYKSELNFEDLKTKLSPESFELFLKLFTIKSDSTNPKSDSLEKASAENQIRYDTNLLQINEEFDSYNSVITSIDNQISTQIETALQESPVQLEQYINLGGATIPVSPIQSISHLAYTFTVIPLSKTNEYNSNYAQFIIELENSSWNILSAKTIAVTDQGTFEENHYNLEVKNNKIIILCLLNNRFNSISKFNIQINFGNSRQGHTELLNILSFRTYTGILTLKGINIQETPKRKNFGIKRLGVADYLKVIQSVHAYVPGLVSNIENVMASELRHKSSVSREYSEITDTTSKYEESEKISDTSKTSRTDMQTEVAKEISKQNAITAHTRFNYDSAAYKFEIGADYANNTSQFDSTRQAVMKSQELTEKATERVLTKISEERIQKIIKEYTETNVHEFDNRGKVTETNNPEAAQPRHISGVYRWIDIKYKNQIYNYGIRTIFEFMVPEPARLHRLALSVAKGQILTAPIDPRKADAPWKMIDAKTATKTLLQYWAEIYRVELTELPIEKKQQAIPLQWIKLSRDNGTKVLNLEIPQNYAAKKVKVNYGYDDGSLSISNFYGSRLPLPWVGRGSNDGNYIANGINITSNYSFEYQGNWCDSCNFSFIFDCELSDEFMLKWKTENFNAIIKAYEEAYLKFQEEQAKLDEEQKQKEQEAKDKIGQFYRYMEQDVLKHNCIAYLLQDYLSDNTIGQSFTTGDKMENFSVNLTDNLDKYTALAKFMEQALEWEIMDYTFYPYYWANRAKWQEMYVSDSTDPLFRSFLQSGMARVIVTVRPGFENAVQFFLETGLIWNGGEVPVIGDPLYMSITEEMKAPLGKPQGKYWITKLPTTLTILQDKSTGLQVTQPLPIFPENDPNNCENPSELETQSSFKSSDISLGIVIGQPSTLPKD